MSICDRLTQLIVALGVDVPLAKFVACRDHSAVLWAAVHEGRGDAFALFGAEDVALKGARHLRVATGLALVDRPISCDSVLGSLVDRWKLAGLVVIY